MQGCWLDWDVIRRDLVEGVNDLVPRSSLEMAPVQSGSVPTRMLASLPVRLVPGLIPEEPEPGWSPARLSLAIAWACLTLAAAAVALLLHGALALSERRGTFVSAVTHELRTPLTTFRLYTEMLDEGMVDRRRFPADLLEDASWRGGPAGPSGRKRSGLRQAGARPGGRRPRDCFAQPRLLDRLAPRLELRARQAGMELIVARLTARSACVSISPWSIKSCRTWSIMRSSTPAAQPTAASIWTSSPKGRWLAVTVRDHGPGLQPTVGAPAVPPVLEVGPGRRAIGAWRRSRSRIEPSSRPRPWGRPAAGREQFTGSMLFADDSSGVTPVLPPRFSVVRFGTRPERGSARDAQHQKRTLGCLGMANGPQGRKTHRTVELRPALRPG